MTDHRVGPRSQQQPDDGLVVAGQLPDELGLLHLVHPSLEREVQRRLAVRRLRVEQRLQARALLLLLRQEALECRQLAHCRQPHQRGE